MQGQLLAGVGSGTQGCSVPASEGPAVAHVRGGSDVPGSLLQTAQQAQRQTGMQRLRPYHTQWPCSRGHTHTLTLRWRTCGASLPPRKGLGYVARWHGTPSLPAVAPPSWPGSKLGLLALPLVSPLGEPGPGPKAKSWFC